MFVMSDTKVAVYSFADQTSDLFVMYRFWRVSWHLPLGLPVLATVLVAPKRKKIDI